MSPGGVLDVRPPRTVEAPRGGGASQTFGCQDQSAGDMDVGVSAGAGAPLPLLELCSPI